MFEPEDALAPRHPQFSEGWHAQALALADTLVGTGQFTASDWAQALGRALKQADADGAPDTEETYYCAVISALETLTTERTAIGCAEIAARKEEWIRAYRTTAHGKPVEL